MVVTGATVGIIASIIMAAISAYTASSDAVASTKDTKIRQKISNAVSNLSKSLANDSKIVNAIREDRTEAERLITQAAMSDPTIAYALRMKARKLTKSADNKENDLNKLSSQRDKINAELQNVNAYTNHAAFGAGSKASEDKIAKLRAESDVINQQIEAASQKSVTKADKPLISFKRTQRRN